MAFVCTIAANRLDFDTTQLGSSRNIRARVGHDDIRNINYFLMLTLDSMAGGDLEFAFSFVRAFPDDRLEEVIRESHIVAQLVSRPDRRQIRARLLRLTSELVRHAGTARICMITYDAHLPNQALEKYWQLCQVFTHCGYKIMRTDPYHGRHAWFMDPAEATNVE